jgi:hypothetical protein
MREPPTASPLDAAEARTRLYVEEHTPAPPTTVPPTPVGDHDGVARELGLTPEMTAKELERARREFALANHPDRVVPLHRDLATRRMTLANMLIDRALQGKRNQPSR